MTSHYTSCICTLIHPHILCYYGSSPHISMTSQYTSCICTLLYTVTLDDIRGQWVRLPPHDHTVLVWKKRGYKLTATLSLNGYKHCLPQARMCIKLVPSLRLFLPLGSMDFLFWVLCTDIHYELLSLSSC